MKKKRKYIYLEKCLIIRILQIYIFSFYDFLFFISLSNTANSISSSVYPIDCHFTSITRTLQKRVTKKIFFYLKSKIKR